MNYMIDRLYDIQNISNDDNNLGVLVSNQKCDILKMILAFWCGVTHPPTMFPGTLLILQHEKHKTNVNWGVLWYLDRF